MLKFSDALQMMVEGLFVVVLQHAQVVLNLSDKRRGACKFFCLGKEQMKVLRLFDVV